MEFEVIPQFILKRLPVKDWQLSHLNVLLSALALAVFFSLGSGSVHLMKQIPHFCLFEKLTGFCCPGCGITRGCFEFFRGNFGESWRLHPAGPMICIFLLFQIPFRLYVMQDHQLTSLTKPFARLLNSLAVSCIFIGWIVKLFPYS